MDESELAAIERAYAERGAPVQVELATAGDPVDRRAAHAPRLRPHGLRERARAGARARARGGARQVGRDPRQPGERVRSLARPRGDRLRLARPPGRRVARGVSARRDRERDARLHGGERLRALDRAARRRPGRRREPAAARRRRPALRRGDDCRPCAGDGIQSSLLEARLAAAAAAGSRGRGGHHAAGFEVAAERPAPGLRAGLRATARRSGKSSGIPVGARRTPAAWSAARGR